MKRRISPSGRRVRASPRRAPLQRVFRWDTGTEGCWQTTLTVTFRPAGLDVESARILPDHFEAVLGNCRLPDTSDLTAGQMMPFGVTVARRPAPSGTSRALDTFALQAAVDVLGRYIAGDNTVRRYFAAASRCPHNDGP